MSTDISGIDEAIPPLSAYVRSRISISDRDASCCQVFPHHTPGQLLVPSQSSGAELEGTPSSSATTSEVNTPLDETNSAVPFFQPMGSHMVGAPATNEKLLPCGREDGMTSGMVIGRSIAALLGRLENEWTYGYIVCWLTPSVLVGV